MQSIVDFQVGQQFYVVKYIEFVFFSNCVLYYVNDQVIDRQRLYVFYFLVILF